jgi:polar amino acid transport system permease protein
MHDIRLISYTWDWSILFQRQTLEAYWLGLQITLGISVSALLLGTCIALLTAVARSSRRPPFVQIAYVYVDFFRTTPGLVQLIWIFYVLPILLGVDLVPFAAGVIALSLNAGAFLSEVFRSGLESIARGQRDAAQVLGMSRWQSMRHVVLPQALRRVLPATGNVFIDLVKSSSLMSVIAVGEVTYQTQIAVSETFRPLELYTALAVIYFALTYPLSLAVTALERRFRIT